jgi:hypothetical protein
VLYVRELGDMDKAYDFRHEYFHRRAVGECRIRIYEQIGERPVVVVTQGFDRFGQPDPGFTSKPSSIAASLIEKGLIRGSRTATTLEMLEKAAQTGDTTAISNSAPFAFVQEVIHPRHELAFIWFVAYYETVKGEIGDVARRQGASRTEVEALIGHSLHK